MLRGLFRCFFAGFLFLPMMGQGATVEVVGDLPAGSYYSYTCPKCKNPWSFCRCDQAEFNARPMEGSGVPGGDLGGLGGGGDSGGGAGDGTPNFQNCYGTHEWQVDMNPGGIVVTGRYSAKTTAVWDLDLTTRQIFNAVVNYSGRSTGVGVTCEGSISMVGNGPGPRQRWSGQWDIKQTAGLVLQAKRVTAIYNIVETSLTTSEFTVN